MDVPLPVLSCGHQAQLNEHGGASHVPVHRNVTGCRIAGWVGENVKSAVGNADADPAGPTRVAVASSRAAARESRRTRTAVFRFMGCAFDTERNDRAPRQ